MVLRDLQLHSHPVSSLIQELSAQKSSPSSNEFLQSITFPHHKWSKSKYTIASQVNPFVRLHFDLICKHQRNRDLLPAVCHRFIFCPKLSTASSPSPPCLLLAKWDYTLVTTPIFCRGYLLCLSPSQKQGENPIKQQQPYTRSCSS